MNMAEFECSSRFFRGCDLGGCSNDTGGTREVVEAVVDVVIGTAVEDFERQLPGK